MAGTRNNSKNESGNASKHTLGSKLNVNKHNKQTTNKDGVNKQKVLLPTLREQQRYAVYKLIFDNTKNDTKTDNKINGKISDFNAVHNNIISQCNALLGIFDGGNAGLMSAKYNADTMKGIIRVNNTYVDKLKVCFGLIKTINVPSNIPGVAGQNVIVDCVYVSGMLNKAIEKMDA